MDASDPRIVEASKNYPNAVWFWDVQKYDAERRPRAFRKVFGLHFDETAFAEENGGGDYRRQLRITGVNKVILQEDFGVDMSIMPKAPEPIAQARPADDGGIVAMFREMRSEIAELRRAVHAPAPAAATGGLSLADVLSLMKAQPVAAAVATTSPAEQMKQTLEVMALMQSLIPKPTPIADMLTHIKALREASGEFAGESGPSESGAGFAALLPLLQAVLTKAAESKPTPTPVAPAPARRPAQALPPRQITPKPLTLVHPPVEAPAATPPPAKPARPKIPFPGARDVLGFVLGAGPAIIEQGIPDAAMPQVVDEVHNAIEAAGGDPADVDSRFTAAELVEAIVGMDAKAEPSRGWLLTVATAWKASFDDDADPNQLSIPFDGPQDPNQDTIEDERTAAVENTKS